MAPISMDNMELTTSTHAMSPSQSPHVQPHFINLDQFEMSIIQSMKKERSGIWSCELCATRFSDSLQLAMHLLTSCGHYSPLNTFSTSSAIHICMVLDESGSLEMFNCYTRVASGAGDSAQPPVLAPAAPPLLVADAMVPRNQEFPANPPQSLSLEAQAEWTFRRDRAGEIQGIKQANLKANGRTIDRAAALAAWNASTHPLSSRPNAANAATYSSFRVLADRESRDRRRLRELTEEAQRIRRG